MSDIVERLRVVPSCWCDEPLDRWESQAERYEAAGLIEQQRDEIERLRALIAEWNEAEREYFNAVNPSPDVVAGFYSALDAFRAEVGR